MSQIFSLFPVGQDSKDTEGWVGGWVAWPSAIKRQRLFGPQKKKMLQTTQLSLGWAIVQEGEGSSALPLQRCQLGIGAVLFVLLLSPFLCFGIRFGLNSAC